ncbi:IS1096 element passenger TnpR family protein [Nocardia acidivorans]|uniref:IS1096 element passenger TnpR family protein n=1 Tax=Nocardia acidivorans TaxID=404580 RepID=UPI00082F5823|nr:hypothetical protein [Nocardia acidivorans]
MWPNLRCPTVERYICPEALGDGDTAVPEEQVRLDELFYTPGDTLFYLYDFADLWLHHMALEESGPRTAKMPRARCVGGMRDCPADVYGGIAKYEYWSRRTDPYDDGKSFRYVTPEDIITESDDPVPSPFVIEEINWALASQVRPRQGLEVGRSH